MHAMLLLILHDLLLLRQDLILLSVILGKLTYVKNEVHFGHILFVKKVAVLSCLSIEESFDLGFDITIELLWQVFNQDCVIRR